MNPRNGNSSASYEIESDCKLRMKRKKMGLSQVELSELCNLPQSFVSKYETGERYLTFLEVSSLCKLLNIKLDDLVRELES